MIMASYAQSCSSAFSVIITSLPYSKLLSNNRLNILYYKDISMRDYNPINLTQTTVKIGLCSLYINSSTELSTVFVDNIYLSLP